MKRTLFLSFLFAAIAGFAAYALDLQEARAKGILGEKADGYVAMLSGGSEAQRLAAEINARRKQEYQRISKENGQPVEVVARLAAEEIINKLPSGSKYQDGSGSWKTR